VEGVDHEADYRALKADGGYVWVRDVVHVIRKDGVTTELVGFIFDISERKKMEDELILLNKKLEQLSFQDGLTNIANRRLFDQTLDTEWQHARRNQQPISLIVVDIDYFKNFNDHYGHQHGDHCLIKIANALCKVSTRSTDLVARYGVRSLLCYYPTLLPSQHWKWLRNAATWYSMRKLNMKRQASVIRLLLVSV
jgi:diguanylate cyclase (GGDEF)-like protein